MANEPTEWKSAVWWRNRPVDERLQWVHFPARIKDDGIKAVEPPLWEPGQNYLLTGLPRSGKSMLAASWVKWLVQHHPLSARWVPADDYVEWIKDSFNNDGEMGIEYSSPYLIKNIKAVWDVIVIDGMGEERETAFAEHELGSLMRKRYDDLRSTIITTRLSVGEFKGKYRDRIAGPLDSYEVVPVGR